MSHAGTGTHGEWRRQASTSMARLAMTYGDRTAWRLTVGGQPEPTLVDTSAAALIREEKQRIRQGYAAIIETAKQAYNRRGRRLAKLQKRGLITQAEFWRLDDEAFGLCCSRERVARMAMRQALRTVASWGAE